jgi:membrane protease YdiL (CAAX protease family)
LFFNLLTAAVVSAGTMPEQLEGTGRPLFVALLGVIPYGLTLLAVLLLISRRDYSLAQGLGIRRVSVGVLLGVSTLVAVVGRGVTGYWTGMIAGSGLEPPQSLDVTAWFPSDVLGIALLLSLTVVIAPVIEEIVYRGMLYPALRRRLPRFAAIAVSGVVFGAVHLNLVWMLVPMTVLGMALAFAFEETRSLYVPVAAHALFNLTGVLMVLALRAAGLA